jgi:hypothetical protein
MKKNIVLIAWALSIFAHVTGAENDESSELVVEEIEVQTNDDEKLIAAVDNLGPSSAGYQEQTDGGPDDEDFVDPRVLRDFVESKGLIACRQKEGLLTIAGDVRARWLAAGEVLDGVKQRGTGTETAINRFKNEINLYLDYVAPRSWITTKLKFVTFSGVDGGSATRVDMERAFIGYDIYNYKDVDFYIEIGRSNLDYMFESKVEFSSIFDGIHLFYTQPWPCLGQFTIHGGPFIVDSFTNHYAWVLETYITDICKSGFSFKYSIVDWFRHAPTLNYGNLPGAGNILVVNNPRYRFVVSQWLLGYEKEIDFLKCKTLFLYGAYLHNWAARPRPQTLNKKLNNAWYIGFTLGKLCKACDWSIDINYQYVQAQAVPEFDLNGIGHGNAANGLLSDAIFLGLLPNDVRLFTNFKGWEINGLYALTDALSLRTKAQYTVPANKGVSGNFHYKAFEMSVIYAF